MNQGQCSADWSAMLRVFRSFCMGVNSPRSLKAYILAREGEYEQLAAMRIHPLEYCDHHSFAGDYAVVSFLKKNRDMPSKADKRGAAIAAFARSESTCKETNARLQQWFDGSSNPPSHVHEVLHLAQRKISMLLDDVDLTSGSYSWGPGATSDLSRRKAYPDTKIVKLPFTVTGSAWKHAARIIELDLHWKRAIISANADYQGPIFKIVPGGRYDTVPKTVLTDRSILVEPRLNTVLQKRIGSQLRARLKRVGVDLDDQTRNQYLAEHANRLCLATLDLEAASDTVAINIVKYLLPSPWFEVMDDTRSKWYQDVDGRDRILEKFSSMGNGFTFELESLIFWSLTASASEIHHRKHLGVYGDDIICHKEVAPLLVEVLTYCGFSLNKEKSFTEGVFYESCGKHFFNGNDVTPAYQKEIPFDGASSARLGNRILRLSARLGANGSLDTRFRGAWEEWRRICDPKREQLGPLKGTGDGYWEVPYGLLLSTRTAPGVIRERYRILCYGEIRREIPAHDDAMYAIWLMSTGLSKDQNSRVGLLSRDAASPRIDREPLVSITGKRGRVKITSAMTSSGTIATREKTRVRLTHRWVEATHGLTYLDW